MDCQFCFSTPQAWKTVLPCLKLWSSVPAWVSRAEHCNDHNELQHSQLAFHYGWLEWSHNSTVLMASKDELIVGSSHMHDRQQNISGAKTDTQLVHTHQQIQHLKHARRLQRKQHAHRKLRATPQGWAAEAPSQRWEHHWTDASSAALQLSFSTSAWDVRLHCKRRSFTVKLTDRCSCGPNHIVENILSEVCNGFPLPSLPLIHCSLWWCLTQEENRKLLMVSCWDALHVLMRVHCSCCDFWHRDLCHASSIQSQQGHCPLTQNHTSALLCLSLDAFVVKSE